MRFNHHARNDRHDDRGVSILIIAVSMIFILGMAGLGIDLASLYVGRSQAQRAADAAALAGAQALVSNASGNPCISGSSGTLSSACMAVATQTAEAVGNQNLVAGVSPAIGDSDVTFLSTSVNDPQIQVIASRDAAHSNPMPTFFVKIFGITTANVSAKAVAEAYTSDGSGPQVGATCVKPWLIPNCDPAYTNPTTSNPLCSSGVGSFVNVLSGGLSSTLTRSAVQAPAGPIGETLTLKPGSPGGAAAPGQYYAVYIPDTSAAATQCPSCASQAPGGGGSGSAAVYRTNIECCNNTPIVCGANQTVTLQSTAGNMVGPTVQGVDCLIHQSGSSFNGGSNCGQDRMGGIGNPCAGVFPSYVTDYNITAGANNPYLSQGANVPSQHSDSVVALPIWDGTPLQSGQNSNVNIVGFLSVFIQGNDKSQQGTVYGTVLGVTSCGGGGNGPGNPGGGPIVATGSPVPIRLIHQ